MMISILAAQALASPAQDIAAQVLAIPPGAMVKVKLRTGEKLRGRLGEVSERQFVLRVALNSRIENRNIAFDEVRTVNRLHPRSAARLSNWLIAGAVIGGITLIALLAVHAMHG